VTVFGLAATRAAWTQCDDWLARAVRYLDGNRRWLESAIAEHLPSVCHRAPEATYLAWLDMRSLDLGVSPAQHFLEHGQVALHEGALFGAVGEGFVRLNFATSRAILEEIVDRMVSCVSIRAR